MKKLILFFGLLSILTLGIPQKAGADSLDCYTTTFTCGNTGVTHTIVVCEGIDYLMWWFLLCNDSTI